jgi:hypothetical protein
MAPLFHISSAANRESILVHGLDWRRMGAARGIAGSTEPEEEGVFLCRDDFEAGFFRDVNNTGGPVDLWVVMGMDEESLIDAGSGFCYFPGKIPPTQVSLTDWPQDLGRQRDGAETAADPKRTKKQRKKQPRAGK